MRKPEQSSIEDRLTRVEIAIRRIEDQVSNLVNEFADLKEKVETMISRLDDHQGVLYGNRGKSGLVSQAEHLEELERALKGYEKEPGLIADIKNLITKMSEFEDSRKWLSRLIIGTVITDIVLHFVKIP